MPFTRGRGWISGFSSFPHFNGSDGQKHGESKVFLRMAAGTRICGSPPISASPTENWGLIFCQKILPTKCGICIRPRVDPRVLRWQETRKIEGFSRMDAGKISVYRQIRRFSWIGRSAPISASPTESWGSMSYHLILLKTCAIFLRPRVDLGTPPHFNYSDGQKYGKSKGFQGWLLEIGAFTRQVR